MPDAEYPPENRPQDNQQVGVVPARDGATVYPTMPNRPTRADQLAATIALVRSLEHSPDLQRFRSRLLGLQEIVPGGGDADGHLVVRIC
jgi:hypothetical protein